MATYAVGDIQGCYTAFMALLDLIGFNPKRDRLWLVGDIVNRGPDSLAMLRFVKQVGDAVIMVLGNHDLHLLMVHAGIARSHKNDTIQSILDAEDSEQMLFWLRHQRLFTLKVTMPWYMPVCCRAGQLPDHRNWLQKLRLLCNSAITAKFLRVCTVMNPITGMTTGKTQNVCA